MVMVLRSKLILIYNLNWYKYIYITFIKIYREDSYLRYDINFKKFY